MKKIRKLIFTGFGSVAAVSAVAGGIVSCGKSTTPHPDKPIPENTLNPAESIFTPTTGVFTKEKLYNPLLNAIKNKTQSNFIILSDKMDISNIKSTSTQLSQTSTADIVTTAIIGNNNVITIYTQANFNIINQKYSFTKFITTAPLTHNNLVNPVKAALYKINKSDAIAVTNISFKIIDQINNTIPSKPSIQITGNYTFNKINKMFTAVVTYDFDNKETYIVSNILIHATADSVLTHDNITTTVINSVHATLQDSKTLATNIRFSLNKNITSDFNSASVKVNGVYTLKEDTIRFSETVNYIYSTKIFTTTNVVVNGSSVLVPFALGDEAHANKWKNQDLYWLINNNLNNMHAAYKIFGLSWSGPITFKNSDYSNNGVAVMHLRGSINNGPDDQSKAPFTGDVSYSYANNTYTFTNVVIKPHNDEVLNNTTIYPYIVKSLQQIPNATPTNIKLNKASYINRDNINDDDPLNPWVSITGTAKMDGVKNLINFSEKITYSYANNSYTISDFK